VVRLYRDYLDWFRDVGATRGFAPIRIQIGDPREKPTLLTRQDWHLIDHEDPTAAGGFWELDVTRPGRYEIGLRLKPARAPSQAHLRIQTTNLEQPVALGADSVVFRDVSLTPSPARLQVWLGGDQTQADVLDARVTRVRE